MNRNESVIRSSGRVGRYLWVLARLSMEGQTLTTSAEISAATGVNPTQVRRDLSVLLGRSGKRGVGYNVRQTLEALRSGATFQVYGDGDVSAVFRDSATLTLLGLTLASNGTAPDVAVLDFIRPEDGRSVAAHLSHAGVSVIVNYAPYLLDLDLRARVVHASPLLTFMQAVT